MKKFIAIMLMLFSVSVFANVNIHIADGLTEQQIAELKATAARLSAENLVQPVVSEIIDNPEKIKEWAEMSGAIAQGVGDTAKELGIAANDFLDSPAGVITVVLIAYHFLGADFINIIFLFLTFPVLLFVYLRAIRWIRVESIDYNEKSGWFGRRIKTVNIKGFNEHQMWAFIVTNVAFFLITWTLIASCLPD